MTTEELAVKVAETDSRARSNTRRIEKLETQTDALNRLVTSVEVIATEQKHQTSQGLSMQKDIQDLSGKVGALESKPAKRWDSISDKIIVVIVTAIITFLLSRIGLQ